MLRRKGGVVNAVVAVATAKALIVRSPDEHFKCLDLDSHIGLKVYLDAWVLRSEHAPHPNWKSRNWRKKRRNWYFNIKLPILSSFIPSSRLWYWPSSKLCLSTHPLLTKHYHARDQNMWQSRVYHSKCTSKLPLESCLIWIPPHAANIWWENSNKPSESEIPSFLLSRC